ncbi:AraC family transcriptional regulator [Paenibacillus pasadenensis]|uniref:Transcriptional regulator, AraC family n=1 Tax=Paenibacillus pasadenensis TaxID=217090 RepID=A0A2N5N4B7_9BACL|nr:MULTISPECIES: AraC family transcriptional regulator [Paenibacillus]PLT45173.1 Transcriptional regulator, AraC family [Paenibacillus pasadenensis]QGG55565.1 helix-turn-helix domain-containing protein [Paenibacillus sp. B01]
MDWLTRMNDTLDRIERLLDGRLDVEALARDAYSSPFHFQRMFHALTGYPLGEYVRRRRLTRAAQELAASGIKVVDVALKYGYESPEAFAKAFRKTHGVTPTMARQPGCRLVAFPKLRFHLSLKGEMEMNYRIEKRDRFTIAGASIVVSCENGENFRRIPQFWQESGPNGTIDRVLKLQPGQPLIGACTDFRMIDGTASDKDETERFRYMIAVEAPAGTVPAPFEHAGAEFVEREVPASTWAVFTAAGPLPESVQSVTKRIFSEWFPSTGYEHAGGPELELYLEDGGPDTDAVTEIWVPVKLTSS